MNTFSIIHTSAQNTLQVEIEALKHIQKSLQNNLKETFEEAIKILIQKNTEGGRLIVTGMGKSGHIGNKLAATFASTGTPSFFVHPAEASHGDLGMITPKDSVLALSWSGETAELHNLIYFTQRFNIPLIAFTANAQSTLGRTSQYCFTLPKVQEACPHGLAPTSSTIMQMALGDALAVALLEAKGFSAKDFKGFHPGGQLGAQLTFIRDIMHQGDTLPILKSGQSMKDALLIISEKGFGCALITDHDEHLLGIITDGDLRRHIDKNITQMHVDDVMNKTPKTISSDELAAKALEVMNNMKITSLAIADKGKLTGLIHMHDLLRIGLI